MPHIVINHLEARRELDRVRRALPHDLRQEGTDAGWVVGGRHARLMMTVLRPRGRVKPLTATMKPW